MSEQWETHPDGTMTRPCGAPYCGHHVMKPSKGRTPVYCSDACKMKHYRLRKYERELAEQRAERKRLREEHERNIAHEHERIERAVESVVQRELTSTKLSTTQRKSLAERITRSLFLVDLVNLGTVDSMKAAGPRTPEQIARERRDAESAAFRERYGLPRIS